MILAAAACGCRACRVALSPKCWNCAWLEESFNAAIEGASAVLAHGAVALCTGRLP